KFYVSRHGLVQCPHCAVHFRAEGDAFDPEWIAGARCPNCETPVRQAPRISPLSRLRNAGRSGLLAAALFGLTAGPLACSGPQDKDTPPDEADTTDTTPEPEPAPDPPDEPEYGVPPQPEVPVEPTPEPLYGVPSPPGQQR